VKFRIVLFGFPIAMMMAGCIVYHPQTTDIPLICEKRDLRVDAGISLIPSVHTTVSYGLTDKIAIQGYASIGSDNRFYLQTAAGLYNSKGNNRILEVYSGFGYGFGDAYIDANPGNLTGNYQLYFGQLNYGKISGVKSKFEMGFGIKTGYLHSNLADRNYYFPPSLTGPYIYRDESILFEPAGFIRIGGDHLKFSVKLGSALIYKFTHTDKHLPYSHFNLGLGVNYRL
jgi:hypothetical protein